MRAISLLYLLTVVCCASMLTAQALPDAPSAVLASTTTNAETLEVTPPLIQPRPAAPVSTPAEQKVVDKKFMLLGGLILATTTADMELTQRCQNAGTCVEMNPTIPRARWAKHAVNAPTNVAVMYWAYKWKKQGKRLWWVPPMVDIAAHVVGLGSNIRFAF